MSLPAASLSDDLLSSLPFGPSASDEGRRAELRREILSAAAAQGPDELAYARVHVARFVETLRLTPAGDSASSLLELGAFFPFTYALRMLGYGEVSTVSIPVWSAGNRLECTIRIPDRPAEVFKSTVANVETEALPFEAGHFDTALACEILEHLIVDPMFMMGEINRVLKTGGILILTTPNACSLRNLASLLAGKSPMLFGKYGRGGNLYARHCREYTPDEVREIIRCSGFELLAMATADVMDDGPGPDRAGALSMLRELGQPPRDRGRTTFAVGRKVRDGVLERYPDVLYA